MSPDPLAAAAATWEEASYRGGGGRAGGWEARCSAGEGDDPRDVSPRESNEP